METDINPIVSGLHYIPIDLDTLQTIAPEPNIDKAPGDLVTYDRLITEAGPIGRAGVQAPIAAPGTIYFTKKYPFYFRDHSLNDGLTILSFPRILKARGDIVFSVIGIILLLPVFMIIGIIIKLSSRGPIFFLQERIGFRGRKFRMIKFRTMVLNAEVQLESLKPWNEANGPVFKIKEDPRITRFGKFLRKNGLDELPQLINVIKGEMSLIGPRPPLEDEVTQYEPWQLRRLSVKPGITCTWQILPNRHSVPFEEWMKMDLHYIDNWSFWKDVELFFRTVKTFFLARGH